MNIQIIRVFSRIREAILSNKDIIMKLEQLEKKYVNHKIKLRRHEENIRSIFNALKELLAPPPSERKRIGYKTKAE